MDIIGTIREFKTENFRVIIDAVEDYDMDLSFDETGEVLSKLQSGKYVGFCARVRVMHSKLGEIGSSYLGGCIHESIEQFQDHRECAAQTRKLCADGSSAVCGSYFSDMIREAISDARATIEASKSIKLRSTIIKQ